MSELAAGELDDILRADGGHIDPEVVTRALSVRGRQAGAAALTEAEARGRW